MHPTDRRQFLRTGFGTVAGLAAMPFVGSLAGCQSAPARGGGAARLATQPLTERVRVISGVPGNVVALAASDGLVLVDAGSAELAPALRRELADAPVRILFNTHYHADQTGGNALFATAGAEIRAHKVTQQWLAADYWSPQEDRWIKAPPKEAVPKVTFRDKGEIRAGNETIEYGYLLEAHTRGDAYVFFRDSNVLAVGDVASPERDPMHDWFAGGWLGGRVDALEDLLALADEHTRIVPAYGPVMTRAELEAEYEVMKKIYDITTLLTSKGRSAKDMLEEGALNDVGRTFRDPARFLYDLAKGYQAHYTNVGVNVV
jgi:glyoxylase-like metal-dependent hydrolase (beta-lactamase superfamily II)